MDDVAGTQFTNHLPNSADIVENDVLHGKVQRIEARVLPVARNDRGNFGAKSVQAA